MTGALELLTVYLGERLGLYQALYADGPATSAELAARTGTVERYVREWLEHHAASGLLTVDDPAAGPLDRRYRLPPGHVPVLADTGDVRYQAFNGTEIVRAARWMPQVAEAFRSGGAPPPLPWAPEGRPEFNRAVFLNLLARDNGCRPSRTWTSGCAVSRRPGWRTWPAARAGPASRWRRPTR